MKTSFAEFKYKIRDERYIPVYIDCEKVVAVVQNIDRYNDFIGAYINSSSVYVEGQDDPFTVEGYAKDVLEIVKSYCKEQKP